MNKTINPADQNLISFTKKCYKLNRSRNIQIEIHYHDILTPPDQSEAPQVFRIRQEGHEDETVQVQALHQDPIVVCSQEIDEQQDSHFTTHLKKKSEANKSILISTHGNFD